MAVPVRGWSVRGRDSARRRVETSAELDIEPPGETRVDAPERDEAEPDAEPPELVLDPLRGAADPDLPLEDEVGVRDPAGVWTRGGSAGAGLDDDSTVEPEDPDDPDELDPPAGRGIA